MRIISTAKFEREYKKLPDPIKDKAEIAMEIFKNNSADARLRVHKLKGNFCGYLAFSVDYNYRIIFRYGNDEELFLITIGSHDIYK